MDTITPLCIDRRRGVKGVHVTRTVSHCLDETECSRCVSNSFPYYLFLIVRCSLCGFEVRVANFCFGRESCS